MLQPNTNQPSLSAPCLGEVCGPILDVFGYVTSYDEKGGLFFPVSAAFATTSTSPCWHLQREFSPSNTCASTPSALSLRQNCSIRHCDPRLPRTVEHPRRSFGWSYLDRPRRRLRLSTPLPPAFHHRQRLNRARSVTDDKVRCRPAPTTVRASLSSSRLPAWGSALPNVNAVESRRCSRSSRQVVPPPPPFAPRLVLYSGTAVAGTKDWTRKPEGDDATRWGKSVFMRPLPS
ncbi:hypothetical protein GALMADRAFT_157326 [Galerina marginata CBS 339.88]|uniref:Uncharacterized protein n=1 Tax=Galerina marginata (strain CBS 339.88) TaxID=685588 RepID=A0A067SXD3_GALM3|nr:hypothetical protein GALMADRAFT_157326 [Galerina marginata CBS 339.88]